MPLAFGIDPSISANTLGQGLIGTGQGVIDNSLAILQKDLIKALPSGISNNLSFISPNSWITKANSRPDPAMHYDWVVELPFSQVISNYVEEVQAPMMNFAQSARVFRAGLSQYYAEAQNIGSITLTFYEDNQFTAQQYLQNWRNKVSPMQDGTYNYPAIYKQNITCKAVDVNQNIVATLVYYGCWPMSVPTISFGSEGSQRIRHSVEFSTDWVLVNFGSAGGSTQFSFGKISDFLNNIPDNILNATAQAASNGIQNTIGGLLGH